MAKAGRPQKYTSDDLIAWVEKHYENGEIMNTAFNLEPKKAGGPTFTTVARHLGPAYGSIQNILLAAGHEPTQELCLWTQSDQAFPKVQPFTPNDVSFSFPADTSVQVFRAWQPYEGNLLWRRGPGQPVGLLLALENEARYSLRLLDPQVEYVRANSTSRIWRVTGQVEYPPSLPEPPITAGSTVTALMCYDTFNEDRWGRLAAAI